MTAAPRVSVVVPTYQRADLLARCLRALLAQRGLGAEYEIVVCDDAASLRTRAQVEGMLTQTGPDLRYVPVHGTRGPAGARNAGWQTARAAVIAFTDDDTMPDPDWLVAGLRAMVDGVHAVTGSTVMPLPPAPTDYERDAAGLTHAEFITANCFVRRAALLAVGGFDTRYTMAWREDSDLHFSLIEQGLRIVRAPQARVVHPYRPVRFAAGLGMQKKVMFDVLLYKKHPDLYRARVRREPPWHYLSVTACLAAATLAALMQQWLAAAVTGLLWLALTLQFFFQRLRGTRVTPLLLADLALTSALIPLLSIWWRLMGVIRFRKGFP